jgi:hypothetical protein
MEGIALNTGIGLRDLQSTIPDFLKGRIPKPIIILIYCVGSITKGIQALQDY